MSNLSRKLHKVIGVLLFLPMLIWGATGLVFFYKPGYAEAFSMLTVKQYALPSPLALEPEPSWRNVKVVQSILGTHVLAVDGDQKIHQRWPEMIPFEPPSEGQLRQLFADATSENSKRYGEVGAINELSATTSTGVQIKLDWKTLGFTQSGKDTNTINRLYHLHYLQWTPFDGFNRVLGLLGIVLIFALAILGALIFIRSLRPKATH